MKKILCLLFILLLTGCGKEEIKVEYDNTYYQVATPYKTSVGGYNIRDYDKEEVELRLMDISKEYFKTNNSLYQEGQYLNSEEIKELVNKYNTVETIEETIVPKYITTIYEQNYLSTNNNLKGISIAIVVDKGEFEEIEALEHAKSKVSDLIIYLRNKEELKNIKIVVGIFLNSNSSLKGTFKYIGDTNNDKINLEYINYNYQQLDSGYIMNNDINNYNNALAIKNSLSEYKNIYINSIGLYKDKELKEVEITINKSYFKASEILNIVSIIKDNLKFDTNTKIYLKSNNKIKAFINKNDNIETYILEE